MTSNIGKVEGLKALDLKPPNREEPDAWPWDRDPEQHPFPPQSGSDETLKASTGCNASSVRSGSELLMRQGSTQHAHPRTQRLEATANINDKIAADA